jgi:hypothetical protein
VILREVVELAADVDHYRAMRDYRILRATPARVLVDRWHMSFTDAGPEAIRLLMRYRSVCEALEPRDENERAHHEALIDSLAVDVAEELVRQCYPSPVTEPILPAAAPVDVPEAATTDLDL